MMLVLFVCGVLITLVVSAGAVYLLLERRRLTNKFGCGPSIGLKNCPICGSRIKITQEAPYIILCENRNCPNSRFTQEARREEIKIYSN
jgi:hypothetical protein